MKEEKTRTKKTHCCYCRDIHRTCIFSTQGSTKKCDACLKRNIDCIIYKPKLKDFEIKRLHKLVKTQEEEISTLKRRLVHYNFIIDNFKQVKNLIDFDTKNQ